MHVSGVFLKKYIQSVYDTDHIRYDISAAVLCSVRASSYIIMKKKTRWFWFILSSV